MVSAVEVSNGLPPLEAVYHCKSVPVAVKEFTVAPGQKVCGSAVGGVVTITEKREESKLTQVNGLKLVTV